MKVLIMGLPGSGKTYLAERMAKYKKIAHFNADKVREMANDWDFSNDARLRQARRMKNLADFEKANGRHVICDFVCPTEQTRYVFEADVVIWMNTIDSGRFADTNRIFEKPEFVNYEINHFMDHNEIKILADRLFSDEP